MGLHHICSNPYHRFDERYRVEMVPDEEGGHILSGMCSDCGGWRIISSRDLKREDVIMAKLKGSDRRYVNSVAE